MILSRLRVTAGLAAAVCLAAACASQSSIKPAEVTDERTGMTVGSLDKPIELLLKGAEQNTVVLDRRISRAYLGPVEWDVMGTLSYGLWVHVLPARDWTFDDIRTPGTVTLLLDGNALALSAIEAPKLAHGPYQPVGSWGQTLYYRADIDLLKRMASSATIELDVEAGGKPVRFTADGDARETLARYLHARGY